MKLVARQRLASPKANRVCRLAESLVRHRCPVDQTLEAPLVHLELLSKGKTQKPHFGKLDGLQMGLMLLFAYSMQDGRVGALDR